MTTNDREQIRAHIRTTYAAAAAEMAGSGTRCSALAGSAYGSCGPDMAGAVTASLGCGSPTELIDLQPGQRVVDLGSGGGLDALLAAGLVGPTGSVIGVDMTPQMLALAEANRAAAGLGNVEFREGYVESLPLDDGSADVVISNGVLSLSVDKPRVLAEAWRVLVPGGLLAVTDLTALGHLPAAVTDSLRAWAGCLAGATPVEDWPHLMTSAGFTDVQVQVSRRFGRVDIKLLASTALRDVLGGLADADLALADGQVASVQITATKPAGPA